MTAERDRDVAAATAAIMARIGGARPSVAMVLGSGLGPLADQVSGAVTIPYADLPGWPRPSVAGHGGDLIVGRLAGHTVACLRGRAHYYERGDAGAMRSPLETLQRLGVSTLLLTNAAGSTNPSAGPGSVVLISDHIDWSGRNPLIGDNGDERFVDLRDAYDPDLRAAFRAVAEREKLALTEGVYMWFSGPAFETPAEIRAAKMLGADLVGMSTVPEVIIARRLRLKVAALSAVTNMAAGMSNETLSHEHTQREAVKARATLTALILGVVEGLP